MKQVFILLVIISLSAPNYGQNRAIKIWNNTTAPHSNDITQPEVNKNNSIYSISEAVLYLFEAEGEKTIDQSILICPGGGYNSVCIAHEGYQMAKWLASEGITCGVLKYRLPNGHPEVPLEDAIEALRILRKNAKLLKINPKKVGILGFSAGGHLAAYTSNYATDQDKPAFSILYYPVISGDRNITHGETFINLLGANASDSLQNQYSLDKQVTKTTPPTLIFLSDMDEIVSPENSLRYYSALKRHNIKASMHIYPDGFHGWGNRTDFKYLKEWRTALLDWLKTL